jgi:hypothetical protein
MRRDYPLPHFLLKALRATVTLAKARLELRRITPQDILKRNREITAQVSRRARSPGPAAIGRSLDEAGFFINRMAARVPWRSDCLVQALAGQRWLARAGIASEIVVGTAKRADGTFEAHAWLSQDGRIVLGGDISTYQPLLDPKSVRLRDR